MFINGIEAFEICRDDGSPKFSFRQDGTTCRRVFSLPWQNYHSAVKALRGETRISADGLLFERTSPHQFLWQEMDRVFTCMDISDGMPKGLPRTSTGRIDTSLVQSSTAVLDNDDVGHAAKVHLVADYRALEIAIFEDDEIDDPISPTLTQPQEWDRYTEWDSDFSSALISVPQGAYKFHKSKMPVNIPIRIPVAEAKITATVYGLPIIPPAAMLFNGAVNQDTFSFYLQPRDHVSPQFFSCDPETLLFLYAKNTKRASPSGNRLYDVQLCFSYRQYGHNTSPYYNPSTKRVTYDRIAADVSSLSKAIADNSAPFRLRNFGYFWTPQTPPET